MTLYEVTRRYNACYMMLYDVMAMNAVLWAWAHTPNGEYPQRAQCWGYARNTTVYDVIRRYMTLHNVVRRHYALYMTLYDVMALNAVLWAYDVIRRYNALYVML